MDAEIATAKQQLGAKESAKSALESVAFRQGTIPTMEASIPQLVQQAEQAGGLETEIGKARQHLCEKRDMKRSLETTTIAALAAAISKAQSLGGLEPEIATAVELVLAALSTASSTQELKKAIHDADAVIGTEKEAERAKARLASLMSHKLTHAVTAMDMQAMLEEAEGVSGVDEAVATTKDQLVATQSPIRSALHKAKTCSELEAALLLAAQTAGHGLDAEVDAASVCLQLKTSRDIDGLRFVLEKARKSNTTKHPQLKEEITLVDKLLSQQHPGIDPLSWSQKRYGSILLVVGDDQTLGRVETHHPTLCGCLSAEKCTLRLENGEVVTVPVDEVRATDRIDVVITAAGILSPVSPGLESPIAGQMRPSSALQSQLRTAAQVRSTSDLDVVKQALTLNLTLTLTLTLTLRRCTQQKACTIAMSTV